MLEGGCLKHGLNDESIAKLEETKARRVIKRIVLFLLRGCLKLSVRREKIVRVVTDCISEVWYSRPVRS